MSVRGSTGLALDLLGRHVLGRAHHEARLGEVGALGGLGDAEVGHLHPAVAGEQHVGRLDVAVHEPRPVGGVERLGHLGGQAGGLPRVDRRRVVDALAQRAPGHQLHHDRLGAGFRAGVVDRHDPRVGEPGGGDRLLPEAGDEAAVGRQVRVEQLHRHLAAQDLVGAPPHLGHPARGDELLEPVPAAEQPARLRRRPPRSPRGCREGEWRSTRPDEANALASRRLRSARAAGGRDQARAGDPGDAHHPGAAVGADHRPDHARRGSGSRGTTGSSRASMSSTSGAKPWCTLTCSIAPASATLSRSTSSAFFRVRALPASSTLPEEMSRIGLIDSSDPTQGLGAADAPALLQVVERVERAEHVGARGQVVDQRDDLVGGRARRRRPRRRAAPGCRARR